MPTTEDRDAQQQQRESIEASLGVEFRRQDLLDLALVHSSYLNEFPGAFPQSNERLEFLGDAVIGAVVAEELYRRRVQWTEGQLTEARSSLVRGETLALVADRLEIGRHLHMGRGDEAAGGRERPTTLAAALEALVGALLLDQGYDAARDMVLRMFSPELSTLGDRDAASNPKSTLQEAVQGRGLAPPTYRIVESSGEDHARQFTAEVTVGGEVLGRGTGPRKSLAEREAAAAALNALQE